MVLKTDGTVWAAGDNDYGQLGDGTRTQKLTFVKVSSGQCGTKGIFTCVYVCVCEAVCANIEHLSMCWVHMDRLARVMVGLSMGEGQRLRVKVGELG